MSRTIHMSVSVRGMLNWDRRETKRNLKWITKNDGTLYASVEEFRYALYDELAAGHSVLPLGECEGFNYQTGCPGHAKGEGRFAEGEPRITFADDAPVLTAETVAPSSEKQSPPKEEETFLETGKQ